MLQRTLRDFLQKSDKALRHLTRRRRAMQDVRQPAYRNLSPEFRAPLDLALTQTILRRALVVGSCFAEGFSWAIGKTFPGAEADFLLFNNASEIPSPPRPVAEYDFQVTVLPLRTVMPQGLFAGLGWNDQKAFAERLRWSEQMSFLQNTLSEVNFPAPGGGEAGWVRQGRSCSRRHG